MVTQEKSGMNRVRVVLGIAALLGLTGCGSVPDTSYTAMLDGAQKALSATFSLSADVANWLEVDPGPRPAPPC
jgi:hypothetical protein